MKRTANNVAVETLLMTIPNNTTILFIDTDHRKLSNMFDSDNNFIYEGDDVLVKQADVNYILYNYDAVKIAKAKIWRTSWLNSMLLLAIDTEREEY